jgi:polyphenol oxidase
MISGILYSHGFVPLSWVQHGFGTRHRTDSLSNSATVRQIHSDLIVRANRSGLLGEGDALITNIPGLAVSVRTADCYPILLADAKKRAVAAVHAGWRGTAASIVQKTIEKMQIEFGTESADIHAAIGPGIGVCCYEVGEEVARQFGPIRAHLDLMSENHRQLESAGVPLQNVEALGICTFCDAERFFSYRRDKEDPGRMTSFIRIATAD